MSKETTGHSLFSSLLQLCHYSTRENHFLAPEYADSAILTCLKGESEEEGIQLAAIFYLFF